MSRVWPASPAKWLIVMLLGLIAACLLIEVGFTASAARGQPGSGAATGGVFVVAGQVTPETYGIYLVDLENATICVYQYLPGTARRGVLRLRAARTFIYDRQLDAYNTEPPPREIKKIVEQHKRLGDATPGQ